MIIMLVPREKSRKAACVLSGTDVLSTKATTNKHMPSPTLSQKAVDCNLSEERIECLTCDRSNYSVRFSAPYPTPPHPCMTRPTHT